MGQFSFLRASFVPFVSLWLVLETHHKGTKNTKENIKKTDALIPVNFLRRGKLTHYLILQLGRVLALLALRAQQHLTLQLDGKMMRGDVHALAEIETVGFETLYTGVEVQFRALMLASVVD